MLRHTESESGNVLGNFTYAHSLGGFQALLTHRSHGPQPQAEVTSAILTDRPQPAARGWVCVYECLCVCVYLMGQNFFLGDEML